MENSTNISTSTIFFIIKAIKAHKAASVSPKKKQGLGIFLDVINYCCFLVARWLLADWLAEPGGHEVFLHVLGTNAGFSLKTEQLFKKLSVFLARGGARKFVRRRFV